MPNSSISSSNEVNELPSPSPPLSTRDEGQHSNIDNDNIHTVGDGARKPQQQKQQEELPIEYQLHETDLADPEMDPLEYTFRRYVPVPKAYFWDTASEANEFNQNLPIRVKWWHRTIYFLGECLKKAEAGGEVVANFLGLNSGPFDYVTDNMTEEEMARSRANVEMRKEEQVEMERRKEGFV